MNQDQRKFLIGKVEKTVKAKLGEIKDPPRPQMGAYLLNAVLSGTVEMQNPEHLAAAIKAKALKCVTSSDKFVESSWRDEEEDYPFKINSTAIFVMPPEFKIALDEYEEKVRENNNIRRQINEQSDGLITRIQLATDKNLDTIIEQVDTMGALRLENFDVNIKLLSNGKPDATQQP